MVNHVSLSAHFPYSFVYKHSQQKMNRTRKITNFYELLSTSSSFRMNLFFYFFFNLEKKFENKKFSFAFSTQKIKTQNKYLFETKNIRLLQKYHFNYKYLFKIKNVPFAFLN